MEIENRFWNWNFWGFYGWIKVKSGSPIAKFECIKKYCMLFLGRKTNTRDYIFGLCIFSSLSFSIILHYYTNVFKRRFGIILKCFTYLFYFYVNYFQKPYENILITKYGRHSKVQITVIHFYFVLLHDGLWHTVLFADVFGLDVQVTLYIYLVLYLPACVLEV